MIPVQTRRLSVAVRSVKPLHSGFLRVNQYELEVERHEGGTRVLKWEVMERGNAVAVLGYDPLRDEVVLANELRPGMLAAGDYPFSDNLVAGAIEPDEDVLQAAKREMLEEAGLELRSATLIHAGAYVSSGGTSEKITIVLGLVDTSAAGGVHGNSQENEDVLTVVQSAEQFIQRVMAGEITDLKTLVAGYWFAQHRSELR
jgi:ADP-ribose pyrophosphatase